MVELDRFVEKVKKLIKQLQSVVDTVEEVRDEGIMYTDEELDDIQKGIYEKL